MSYLFEGKKFLITGGTGSFGKAFIKSLLNTGAKKIYVFSRDELKQWEFKKELKDNDRVAFLVGDIRDKNRLDRAMYNINYVVHAAALKQVPSCEYNPEEAVKTNINGAMNIINAAIDNKIEKAIALSTDKAVAPVNLYGNTKACMEKLFINGNAYAGGKKTIFSCVRYGNVVGSRGSVVKIWQRLKEKGINEFPLTDIRMTRFLITLRHATTFVMRAVVEAMGGEIFIPKMDSAKMASLAEAIHEKCNLEIIGIRPGEKIHETLIPKNEIPRTVEQEYYFIVCPEQPWFDFSLENIGMMGQVRSEYIDGYSSDSNDFLTIEEIRGILKDD